jgi:hypothetical protein
MWAHARHLVTDSKAPKTAPKEANPSEKVTALDLINKALKPVHLPVMPFGTHAGMERQAQREYWV